MTSPNVLPLSDPPRQKSYRQAVAKLIRDLKANKSLSNTMLAEEIGCCAETISNAENENNDLSAVILLRIAYRFGEAAIAPVRELYLCSYAENAPLTATDHREAIEHHTSALLRMIGEAA